MMYRIVAHKRSDSGIRAHCSEKEGNLGFSTQFINIAFMYVARDNAYYKELNCACEDAVIAKEE